MRREEQRHPLHQLDAVDARRERAVRRHEHEQQQRLAGRRIALHLGAALAEDEHLARGLEHVVRGEDQEHDQREQQRARHLVTAHVGDRRQQPLADGLRPWLGHVCSHCVTPAVRGLSGMCSSPTSFRCVYFLFVPLILLVHSSRQYQFCSSWFTLIQLGVLRANSLRQVVANLGQEQKGAGRRQSVSLRKGFSLEPRYLQAELPRTTVRRSHETDRTRSR